MASSVGRRPPTPGKVASTIERRGRRSGVVTTGRFETTSRRHDHAGPRPRSALLRL